MVVDIRVEVCLQEAGLTRENLFRLATHRRRQGHAGLVAAAAALDLSIAFVDGVAPVCQGQSSQIALERGLAGTAETAAQLAGPLVLPKRKSAHATCALGLAQSSRSALRMPSMLSASAAGS